MQRMKTNSKDKTMTKYKATDEDVAAAQVLDAADALGIEVSPDELQKFAVLLIALQEE
jgi:hypothetical protein